MRATVTAAWPRRIQLRSQPQQPLGQAESCDPRCSGPGPARRERVFSESVTSLACGERGVHRLRPRPMHSVGRQFFELQAEHVFSAFSACGELSRRDRATGFARAMW